MSNDKDYQRLIHTMRWLKLRKQKLSAQPLCETCLAEGRISSATEVHHVKPVEDALSLREKTRLMYDPHNLRSLCHQCHVEAHKAMGRGGRQHTARQAKAQLEEFKRKFLE